MPFIPPENYFNPPNIGNQTLPWGGAMLPEQNRPEPPVPGPFGADMPRDLQSMIAPYRDMASKFSSPYLMMNKDSWLAQRHPGAAGIIDNALSAVALSKFGAPATVGQNLSAALGGAMEATQMKRQQLMQQAMLPYHMLQPQLAAEHTLAQIGRERTGMAEDVARTRLYETQADAKMAARPTGKVMIDKSGQPWHEIHNPLTNEIYMVNPISQERATPEQELEFRQTGTTGSPNVDYTLSGILRRQAAGDPTAASDYKSYMAAQGAQTGAHVAATKAIDQPIAESEKFRDNELKRIQEPKVLSPSEFGKLHENDIDYILDAPNKYKQYSDAMNQQVGSVRDQKAAYESSNAWKKGISFQDWQKNPVVHNVPTKAKSTKAPSSNFYYDAQGNRVQGPPQGRE